MYTFFFPSFLPFSQHFPSPFFPHSSICSSIPPFSPLLEIPTPLVLLYLPSSSPILLLLLFFLCSSFPPSPLSWRPYSFVPYLPSFFILTPLLLTYLPCFLKSLLFCSLPFFFLHTFWNPHSFVYVSLPSSYSFSPTLLRPSSLSTLDIATLPRSLLASLQAKRRW